MGTARLPIDRPATMEGKEIGLFRASKNMVIKRSFSYQRID
jgi:hypothetical protein